MVIKNLLVKIGVDVSEYERAFKNAQSNLKNLGESLQKTGMALSAAVTLPLAGLGAAAFKAALDVDDAMDLIRIRTGATGKALESLEGSAKAVARNVPQNIKEVSQVIADLNTRTKLTGPALEKMAKQTLDAARLMGIDSAQLVASFTRTLGDWGIEIEAAPAALDTLFAASQMTGVGLDQLNRSIVQYGAPLRQMGFDFETAAALIGKFEKEGVNSELVMGSLRIALGNMAREGKPVVETFRAMMDQIQATGDTSEANRLALELFGARAGPDMAAAIREGRFELGSLVGTLRASSGAVQSANEDTRGFAEIWEETKNKIILALEPLGKVLVGLAENVLPKIASVIEAVAAAFAQLPGPVKTALIAAGGIAAALGPALLIIGKLVTMVPTLTVGLSLLGKAFLGALGPIGLFTAAATAAYKITNDLIKAKERAVDADYALFESQQRLGKKLREAADAAGMTRREFVELSRKYDDNTAALAMAIKRGQEGEALQKALAEVGAKHAAAIDKQRGALELEREAQEKVNLALAQTEEQIKLVVSLRQQLTDEIKKATLSETEYSRWALKTAYEERVATIEREVKDENTRSELLMASRKSFHAQLAALESSELEKRTQDELAFLDEVRAAESGYWAERLAAAQSFQDQRAKLTDGIMQLTLSEHDYRLWALEQERVATETWINEHKTMSIQQKEELLEILADYYVKKRALAEGDASEEIALAKETEAALTNVYRAGFESILGAFEEFGSGAKTVFAAFGSAIKETVNTALSALKQLVAGVLAAAAKNIIAKHSEAVANVISSVMGSIPFPFSLAVVGGAIAAVNALFSAIKLGEGGLVTGPTLALVGEAGPEMVIPLNKLGLFAGAATATEGPSFIYNQYGPLIETTSLTRSQIDDMAPYLFNAIEGQARRRGYRLGKER